MVGRLGEGWWVQEEYWKSSRDPVCSWCHESSDGHSKTVSRRLKIICVEGGGGAEGISEGGHDGLWNSAEASFCLAVLRFDDGDGSAEVLIIDDDVEGEMERND